jgi:hypothetical protein
VVAAPTLRFRFELTPLEDVTGWGESRDKIHWFGLTDGRYWVEVGEGVRLPAPEVDYYVARLWEDVLQLTASVLEPTPPDLVALLASDPSTWTDPYEDWTQAAVAWHGDHLLDFGYVTQAPRVMAWRLVSPDADEVTVLWAERKISAEVAVEVQRSTVTIPTSMFCSAVDDFDTELIQAMAGRVRDVLDGRLPPRLSVHHEGLGSEHQHRAESRSLLLSRSRATDWDAVRAGAQHLLGQRG